MHSFTMRFTTLGSVIALLLGPAAASAASFALLEQSASRLGTAFAGSGAVADDATTLYFNPAGLTHLSGRQATFLPSAVEITSEFHNKGSTTALGQPLGTGGGDAGGWNLVPSIYLSTPLNDDWTVGFGVNAPFGLKLEYDAGWIGRFQALNSEVATMNFNPAVAYRVNPRFSIGAGIDYQRIQAEFTSAVNYSAAIAQGLQQLAALGRISLASVPTLIAANAGLEGTSAVRGDDSAWGYNFGLMFDLSDSTRLGLAYRSAINFSLTGAARFVAPAVTQPVGASILAVASAPGGALATGPVSVKIKMPDSALLSVVHALGSKVELLADVAWTGWSSIQELRIVRDSGTTLSVTPERWHDAWRFSLGGTYQLNPVVKLRGGVALDETPVPDSTRTPRLPDGDRTWIALGAQWNLSAATRIDVAYAHVVAKTVPLNQDAGNATAYGTLMGDQQSDIEIVSAQLQYRF